MKLLQIERDALLSPLQAVTGIVEKRHTLPILSNVLIERKSDKLNLIATDLEIQITTSCDVGGKADDQSLTLSARKLQDILRSLPEGSETTLDLQANKVQLKAGKSRFNLQTMPADDFPKMANAGDRQAGFSISQKLLQELLLLVQFAMAQQDIRYYLNGLLLVLDGDKIKVVATDGHRLSYAEGKLDGASDKREVILPRKAVLELSRQLGSTDAAVDIEIYASQVRFRYGDSELITKVIDGKFPDYTRVIPVNYQQKITVNRQDLLHSLQRAAILSNEKFRGVRWMLTADSLRISCTNTEQEEAQEEMEVNYNGDALDVGFNITYLLDVLNNVSNENVECAFGDANSSMLITLPGRTDFRYVVMPMRI
ncbi:MAG: DNA polymerase III subunit beta [Betaproteobacteria bacterium]|nr:DNA polymerase III subunit beta [Betaproteobacteria bacterium]